MSERIKVMTIFGTRPEAIKMAPLVLELNKRSDKIETIVTVTAQHREMLDQVLDIFQITPDYDLNVMKQNQTLAQITTRVLEGLDQLMKDTKPDICSFMGIRAQRLRVLSQLFIIKLRSDTLKQD